MGRRSGEGRREQLVQHSPTQPSRGKAFLPPRPGTSSVKMPGGTHGQPAFQLSRANPSTEDAALSWAQCDWQKLREIWGSTGRVLFGVQNLTLASSNVAISRTCLSGHPRDSSCPEPGCCGCPLRAAWDGRSSAKLRSSPRRTGRWGGLLCQLLNVRSASISS